VFGSSTRRDNGPTCHHLPSRLRFTPLLRAAGCSASSASRLSRGYGTTMSRLGTFEVLFELARGGMGTVELAIASGAAGVERLVAIKRIRPHLDSANEAMSRFLDEARVISHVHHANVVGLHQASEDDRGFYLVFDYVEGETLGGLIDLAKLRREKVPLPVLIRIILDALNGL